MSEAVALRLVDLPWPPFAAREVVQELRPVGLGDLRRTVNGDLRHVDPGFARFETVIRGQDVAAPAFDGVFRGLETQVECARLLTAPIPAGAVSVTLARDPVPGSGSGPGSDPVTVRDGAGVALDGVTVAGREVSLPAAAVQTVFALYRPLLTMRVESWEVRRDERGAELGWEIRLIEI